MGKKVAIGKKVVKGTSGSRSNHPTGVKPEVREFRERVRDAIDGAKTPTFGRNYYYDAGADTNELADVRSRMLDDSPDTYWQIELTYPFIDPIGELSKNADTVPSNDLERISGLVQQLDPGDLVVSVIVDLGEVVHSNWISLMPMVFQDGNWLEVLSVDVAIEAGEFEQLPDLESHMNEAILTPEANEDLSSWEAAGVLTDGKSFTGLGLWVFPMRELRYVRFSLRQMLPIPAPYTVYNATLEREVTLESNTKVNVPTEVDLGPDDEVELDYERSAILESGDQEIQDLVPKQDPHEIEVEGRKATLTFGEWGCTDLTEVAKWDRMRYAIGIRDVQISGYTYVEKSSFASVRYSFPKPVMKIALEALEIIPKEMIDFDPSKPWITYYVSFDDSTWHQIAPLSKVAPGTTGGEHIPQILNVDSELPVEDRAYQEGYIESGGDPYTIRLKVVFSRPVGTDYEGMSPVLRSYRVKGYLREGLY